MRFLAKLLCLAALLLTVNAWAEPARAGIVIMHGKGGSPSRLVADLASALERDGFLVANLEMPWSGKRQYDVDVSSGEAEVESALATLRKKGAARVFVAGHSQGGVFALYYGSKHPVDGIIAIAPGGNVGNALFRDKLGEQVALARQMIGEGRGQEQARFGDFEGSKGVFPVMTTASSYLSWFDPEGAMNQKLAMRNIPAQTPVLFIAPTRDYPGLLRVRDEMFGLLAKHPLTRMVQPEATHTEAPSASLGAIESWISTVVGQ